MNKYSVAVYKIQQEYGGPEEGGWWFAAGERQDDYEVHQFDDLERMHAYRDRLQAELDEKYAQNKERDFYSVNAGGYYSAEVSFEGYTPKYFPESRPYYE